MQSQRLDSLHEEIGEMKEGFQHESAKFEQLRIEVEESNKQERDDLMKTATHITEEQGKLREDIRLLMAAATRSGDFPPGFGPMQETTGSVLLHQSWVDMASGGLLGSGRKEGKEMCSTIGQVVEGIPTRNSAS